MTYRHIYTDPNPCPCCEGYRTEPRAYYPIPDHAGGGRKCADCGTARPDAFDPDRDPFNPEREGWTGWVKRHTPEQVLHVGRVWYGWVVKPRTSNGRTRIWKNGSEVLYDNVFIPHRTVVSILVSNGYVPEVGV